jgi:hypothetical protein
VTKVGGAVPSDVPTAVNATDGRVCVVREVVGAYPVQTTDCFETVEGTVGGSDGTVQWTTTVESSASELWTAPVGRGVDFALSPSE